MRPAAGRAGSCFSVVSELTQPGGSCAQSVGVCYYSRINTRQGGGASVEVITGGSSFHDYRNMSDCPHLTVGHDNCQSTIVCATVFDQAEQIESLVRWDIKETEFKINAFKQIFPYVLGCQQNGINLTNLLCFTFF